MNKVVASLQVRASRGRPQAGVGRAADSDDDGDECSRICSEMRSMLRRHHESMLFDISKQLDDWMDRINDASKQRPSVSQRMSILPFARFNYGSACCAGGGSTTAPNSMRSGPICLYNEPGLRQSVIEGGPKEDSQGKDEWSPAKSKSSRASGARASTRKAFQQAAKLGSQVLAFQDPSAADLRRKTKAMDLQVEDVAPDEPKVKYDFCQRFLIRVVTSDLFEIFFALMILSNSFFVGMQVEWAAKNARNDTAKLPASYSATQISYTGIFLLELIARIGAHRQDFFCSSATWYWNYLDLFIVTSSVMEVFLNAIANASNIRIARIARITRLFRVFRVIRVVRFIHALRTLVYSIVCTMKSLIWAMLLLLLIIYVFGILFTQATSEHLASLETELEEYTLNEQSLDKYWSLLPRAMFTLFKSITGGISWDAVVDPLSDVSWFWVGTFAAFISFCFLAVLNVVTGVFCQSAIEAAQQNEDLIIQGQIQNKKMYVERIRRMFAEIDSDDSGYITIAEFEKHLEKGTVQAYFASLDMDAADAWTLFKLLDQDEGNLIDLEEFVVGCMRLKGNAKSVDIAKLALDNKRMYNMLCSFAAAQEERNAQLDSFAKNQEALEQMLKKQGQMVQATTMEMARATMMVGSRGTMRHGHGSFGSFGSAHGHDGLGHGHSHGHDHSHDINGDSYLSTHSHKHGDGGGHEHRQANSHEHASRWSHSLAVLPKSLTDHDAEELRLSAAVAAAVESSEIRSNDARESPRREESAAGLSRSERSDKSIVRFGD